MILREKLLRPILAGVGKRRTGRKPRNWSLIDQHYETIRQGMFTPNLLIPSTARRFVSCSAGRMREVVTTAFHSKVSIGSRSSIGSRPVHGALE